MKIGIDLDNTIICYDRAIEQLADETLSIPATLSRTKASLRDYLRAEDREDEWTEFQGRLYGPGMSYAEPFPKCVETIQSIQQAGHTTFIISHRTRHPYLGPKYDLHDSARNWIKDKLKIGDKALFDEANIYLNETRDAKIEIANTLQCEVFIDDLIEVLSDTNFASQTKKLLFAPGVPPEIERQGDEIKVVKSWTELQWLSQA